MKYKFVSTIAALLCGAILLFTASMTACTKEETMTQNSVRTAEFELNPPADAADAANMPEGAFHFSFATGKTEWIPARRPANIQDLAERAMRARNQEKSTAELVFSIMVTGEFYPEAPIMILSEDEIKSILSTGALPEKKQRRGLEPMKPDSWYLLKDETDHSTYVFKFRDYSLLCAWLQIAYVRIPDGMSWKENPDLTALLNMPPQAIEGLKSITITTQTGIVPNFAEGTEKKVEAKERDLKTYFPAAAKAGDVQFFSRDWGVTAIPEIKAALKKTPELPDERSFKKVMLQAGCDYFDGVDEYPVILNGSGEDEYLLLSLNKRCAAIPDDKVESLCKNPAKLVGDYCGVPVDLLAAEPMVLLETSGKKFFLIVGFNLVQRFKIFYLEIPRGGITKEQAKAIREYRPVLKKKMNADLTRRLLELKSREIVLEQRQNEERARQEK